MKKKENLPPSPGIKKSPLAQTSISVSKTPGILGTLSHSAGAILGLKSPSLRDSSETTQSDRSYLLLQSIKEFTGPCYVVPKQILKLLASTFVHHPLLGEMFDNYLKILTCVRECQFNLYRHELCWLQNGSKPAVFFPLHYAVTLQGEINTVIADASESDAIRNFTKELLHLAGVIQNSQANRDYFMAELSDPDLLRQSNIDVSILQDQPIIVNTRKLELNISNLLNNIKKLDFIEEKLDDLRLGNFQRLGVPDFTQETDEPHSTIENIAKGLKREAQLKHEVLAKIRNLKAKISALTTLEAQTQFLTAVQTIEKDWQYTPTLGFGPHTIAEWISVERSPAQAFIKGYRLFGLKQNERAKEFEVPLDLSRLGELAGNRCKSVVECIYELDSLFDDEKNWLDTFVFALKLQSLETLRRQLMASPLKNKSALAKLKAEEIELYTQARLGMALLPETLLTLQPHLLHELLQETFESNKHQLMQLPDFPNSNTDLNDDVIKGLLLQYERKVIDTQIDQLRQMVNKLNNVTTGNSNSFEAFLQDVPSSISAKLNELDFLNLQQKLELLKLAAQFSYEFDAKTVALWMSFGFDDDESHFSVPHQVSLILTDLTKFIGPNDKLAPVLTQNLHQVLSIHKEFRQMFRKFLRECVNIRRINYAILNKPFARLISPSARRHADPINQITSARFELEQGFYQTNSRTRFDQHIADFMQQILMRSGCCLNQQAHTDDYVSLLAPRTEAAPLSSRPIPSSTIKGPAASDLIIANTRSLKNTFFTYQQSLRELSYINAHFDEFVEGNLLPPIIQDSSSDQYKNINFNNLFAILTEIEKTKQQLGLQLSILGYQIRRLEAKNPQLARDVRMATKSFEDVGYIEGSYYFPAHKSNWINVKYSDQVFVSADRMIAFEINNSIHKIVIPLDLSTLGKITGDQSQAIFNFIYAFEEKLTVAHFEAVSNFYFATALYYLHEELSFESNKPIQEQNQDNIASIQRKISEVTQQIQENFKLDPEINETAASNIKKEISSYEAAIKAHLDGENFQDQPLISEKSDEITTMLDELDFLTSEQKARLVLIANDFAYQLTLNYYKMFMEFGFNKEKIHFDS